MRKIYIFGLIGLLSLSACDRKIPSGGSVVLPKAERAFANSDLSQETLYLYSNQTQFKPIRIQFGLAYHYKLYRLDGGIYHKIETGDYQYQINPYTPQQAQLVLLGSSQLGLILKFNSARKGQFQTNPDSQIPMIHHGLFYLSQK